MWWFQQGMCILPVALVIWTAATFAFAYITAVLLKHVDPLVPYISDTGSEAPERCVFGIMLNISALLGISTTYVRYKQVQALTDQGETRVHQLNLLGIILGWTSSLGMCVVGNFQKTTIFSIHIVGAVLTFGVGALYIMVQAGVSYRMQPHVHSKSVFWVRLSVAAWSTASSISMFVSSMIMYSSLPGVDLSKKLHWIPGETGYTAHLISTISEWSLAFSFVCFFFTYIRDFQKINLRAEVMLHSSHLYESSHYGVIGPLNPGENSPLLAGSI
ncbi:DNA damage-regulated autophagy modulator protein 2b [Alosa pseudoharengus]|uniref:DNA damage-regulated autophagy modulator protein 2b n=1 Tax=Alosa pseudoharengus TaxID=34774 RepID=UPI003F8C36DF